MLLATSRNSQSFSGFVSIGQEGLRLNIGKVDCDSGYLNLRMVIHAIFMIDTETGEPEEPTLLQRSRLKCIQSAEETIDLIYSTFLTDDYFQTWYAFWTLESVARSVFNASY